MNRSNFIKSVGAIATLPLIPVFGKEAGVTVHFLEAVHNIHPDVCFNRERGVGYSYPFCRELRAVTQIPGEKPFVSNKWERLASTLTQEEKDNNGERCTTWGHFYEIGVNPMRQYTPELYNELMKDHWVKKAFHNAKPISKNSTFEPFKGNEGEKAINKEIMKKVDLLVMEGCSTIYVEKWKEITQKIPRRWDRFHQLGYVQLNEYSVMGYTGKHRPLMNNAYDPKGTLSRDICDKDIERTIHNYKKEA